MSVVICMRCGTQHKGDNICQKCLVELGQIWIESQSSEAKTISDRNMPIKTLGNTCASRATKNVKDITFWGDGDLFKLLSKASSNNEGWMKSTKAMMAGTSVVLQVTTQQRNKDGSYAVAEAVTTIPNVKIIEEIELDSNEVKSRKIVPIDEA